MIVVCPAYFGQRHAARAIMSFDAFLTHDWGTDELGRSNHARVGRVAEALRAAGLSIWFDADEMRGDINQQMADGIDHSACCVVFVTERYVLKASGKGEAGADDNWCAPGRS